MVPLELWGMKYLRLSKVGYAWLGCDAEDCGLPKNINCVQYCWSYGVHMVRAAVGDQRDGSNVVAAARDIDWRWGALAYSRPASAAAVCGIGKFLFHFRRRQGGGVRGAASDSAVSFH